MNNETFSIGEAVRAGWDGITRSLGVWIAMYVVLIAVSFTDWAAGVVLSAGGGAVLVGILLLLGGWLVQGLVAVGLIDASLRAVDGRPVRVGVLFKRWDSVVPFILSSLLFGLTLGVGLVLLVIPGLIVLSMWYFYAWDIVNEGSGPVAALQNSASLTKGHRLRVLVFLLAMLGINLLGALALLVGLLLTFPLTLVATGHVYRRLKAIQAGSSNDSYEVPGTADDPSAIAL